jgi:methyl-accepting chemotaxis protein
MAREAGSALNEIVAGSGEVTRLIDEIAHATDRQQVSVREVGQNIARIVDLIDGIRDAVGDCSGRTDKLASVAEELHRSVGEFRVEK